MERDQLLIERFQGGDARAFRELVELYQRKVFAQALAMIHREEEAMDVSQEVFIKVYRNLNRFQGEAAFSTWLYRITHNVTVDHLRRRSRRREVDLDEDVEREREQEDDPERSPGETPEEALQRRQSLRQIEAALRGLSEKHRSVIVMREIEGLSYKEIAQALQCSMGTVMSRLFHARRKLRASLEALSNEAV